MTTSSTRPASRNGARDGRPAFDQHAGDAILAEAAEHRAQVEPSGLASRERRPSDRDARRVARRGRVRAAEDGDRYLARPCARACAVERRAELRVEHDAARRARWPAQAAGRSGRGRRPRPSCGRPGWRRRARAAGARTARASGPVTQRGRAVAAARSGRRRETAILSCTNGRPLGHAQDVAGRHPARRLGAHAHVDVTPASRSTATPLPETRGSGSSIGAHHAARCRRQDGVGTGRRAAVMRAGLERDVHGLAARPVAGDAPAHRLRMRAARRAASSRARSPRRSPGSAITAPTAGLGAVRPSMRAGHAQRQLHEAAILRIAS